MAAPKPLFTGLMTAADLHNKSAPKSRFESGAARDECETQRGFQGGKGAHKKSNCSIE